MEQGLAQMVINKYGSGEGQNTKHYYAGTTKKKDKKKKEK